MLDEDTRWRDQRPAREMLECQRVILKRTVQVGLRWMAGVTRLGEETEIGQPEPFDQFAAFGDIARGIAALVGGVNESGDDARDE